MHLNCPTSRPQRAAAAAAVIFGLLTIVAGGRLLLGLGDAGYYVVRPVLWFNVAMGVAYLMVAAMIHRSASLGKRGAAWIVLVNVAVLVALVGYAFTGGEVARQTFAAMIVRTLFWVGEYIVLSIVSRSPAVPRPYVTGLVLLGAAFLAVPAQAQTSALSHAIELFEARRYASAESALVALSRSDSTDARVPLYLGQIALARGRTDEAIGRLETAVRRDERSAISRTWLARALMAQAQGASVLRRPGLARRARGELERAVELDPRSVPARRTLMEVYLRAPRALGGNRGRAEEQQAAIAALDPAEGHLARAVFFRQDDDAVGAERELRAALRVHATSVEAYEALGRLLADTRRHDEAAATYVTLGHVYERQGWSDDARRTYMEAARLEPGNREARAGMERVRP